MLFTCPALTLTLPVVSHSQTLAGRGSLVNCPYKTYSFLSALTHFPLSLQNFQSEISGMCVEGVFSGERNKQLNMVICEHLFRQGKLDVGERLVQVWCHGN